MSDDNTITRREWELLLTQLTGIANAVQRQAEMLNSMNLKLGQSLEREAAHFKETDDVKRIAADALALAQKNRVRISILETNNGGNTKTIDSWKSVVYNVVGGSILVVIGAVAGLIAARF